MKAALRTIHAVLKAIQLTLPRAAVGWMFALMTSNFNRIAIHELGVTAVIITTMLGLYHFLSPFQVIFGRIADQMPILGMRRSPYVFFGLLLSSLIFVPLPAVAVAMSGGALWAFAAGFGLLILFGIGFAIAGSSHLALVADVTTERTRGIVIAMVWTVLIASTIVSLVFIRGIMPEYDPVVMQSLYARTVPIVIGLTLLGLIGVEPRLSRAELEEKVTAAKAAAPERNVWHTIQSLLNADRAAKSFFIFVFLSTLGVFLQDTILEVFGAEVMGMTVDQTGRFQQMWGGGVLLGMFLMGFFTLVFKVSRSKIAMVGTSGSAFGMMLIVYCAFTVRADLIIPSLIILGFFTGLYTLGALTMMMEMTTDAARATYLGLWGLSQSLANGLSAIIAGALVTLIIESGFLAANVGYGVIFTFEAGLLLAAAFALRPVNIRQFQEVTRSDMVLTMEMEAA